MRMLCLLLAVAILLAGCSSNSVLRWPVNVTIGHQLIDLKKARDSGALSDREYDQQRRQLIESVN